MDNKKSIFQRAAEWGIPFGLYLTCTAMTSIFADWFAPLGLIFFLLVLAAPVVVYYFQRRKFIEDDGFTEFAAIWMLGILLYILGCIISSFFAYLVLQYGRPNFMYEQAQAVIKSYNEIPEDEYNKVVNYLIDGNTIRMLGTSANLDADYPNNYNADGFIVYDPVTGQGALVCQLDLSISVATDIYLRRVARTDHRNQFVLIEGHSGFNGHHGWEYQRQRTLLLPVPQHPVIPLTDDNR